MYYQITTRPQILSKDILHSPTGLAEGHPARTHHPPIWPKDTLILPTDLVEVLLLWGLLLVHGDPDGLQLGHLLLHHELS